MSDGLDLSRLAPADGVAALRSYPRRFRSLLTSFDDDERPDDLVHRADAGGRSAVDHADHVARSTAMLGQALQKVLVQDQPTLLPAVADDDQRDWQVAASSTSVDAVLDFLDTECHELADVIDGTSSSGWARAGVVAGSGRRMTALDVVREAVRTGSDHLRAAEHAIQHARRA